LAIQTIDYGIMEHAEKVAVILAKDMRWNDVGSWTSLFEVLQPDEDGNVVISENFHNFDSHNSLVHTNGQGHMVVLLGTRDLVVVDTGDVLLVCSKDRAQEIRRVIDFLKENGLTSYL
jgi:mannose-1-phosphate guanylyltransferase